MPTLRQRDKERLREVKEPPFYDEEARYTDDKGFTLPKRRMNDRGGLPQGPKWYRRGGASSADAWNEWDPGEFKRSYPKNKQNKEWYSMHSYGRVKRKDGSEEEFDGWNRKAGPMVSEAKENMKRKAAAKHADKKEKSGNPLAALMRGESGGNHKPKPKPPKGRGKPEPKRREAPPKKKGKK